jgi:hypothetical protein
MVSLSPYSKGKEKGGNKEFKKQEKRIRSVLLHTLLSS